MSNRKSPFVLTASMLGVIALAVLSFVIKAFWLSVLTHIVFRFLGVLLMVVLIQRCFKDQLTHSRKKALILCGVTLSVDLVIVDAVRFVLSGGVSTILFLPACLPICFMILMLFSAKDTGKGSREKVLAFLIGIPLLLLSLYFETASLIGI